MDSARARTARRKGTISPHALSRLIGSIYDCALDPDLWNQTLADIKSALDFQTAVLALADPRADTFVFSRSAGILPEWAPEFQKHVPEINAVTARALADWPSLDEPLVMTRYFSAEWLANSPYYQEGLLPSGLVDVMQFFLIATPLRFSVFGIARNEQQGFVTDREIELGKLLVPHIRRAVTISDVLDVKTIERTRMAEALNTLRCGVVLCNRRGAILHANRAAEELLRRGDLVAEVRGRFVPAAPSAAKELRAAIELSTGNEAEIGHTGLAVRLTGPDREPVFAHVLPMTGGEVRTRLLPEAVAAVFIGEPANEKDAATLIAAIYDLTPAEMRVLAGLLQGLTLARTAHVLGIKRSTAKSHLERIFIKTGTSRQTELAWLTTRMAPPR
jgi:DNA-binding CsgD family transcriptional regulator/PAS domain-containing protein